jgi:hypothetical protein
MKKIYCFIAALIILFPISSCSTFKVVTNDNVSTELQKDISKAILSHYANRNGMSETQAEGHIVLGQATIDGNQIIYALTTFGGYGFQNDALVKISGAGPIPVKMTFVPSGNREWSLKDYQEPADGEGNLASLKKLFPSRLIDVAKNPPAEYLDSMVSQEKSYANTYLKSIGRVAQVGAYRDFEHQHPNMNVQVSDFFLKMFNDYPMWIGTNEKIENGTRYVYELQWQDKGSDNGVATFKKYEYKTKTVVSEYIIDINDGNMSYSDGSPNKDKALLRHIK